MNTRDNSRIMKQSDIMAIIIISIASITTLGILSLLISSNGDNPVVDGSNGRTCIYGDFVADPSDAVVEIDMPAYQWKFAYCSITVYEGQRVIINMRSLDVPHGFAIDGYEQVRAFIPPDVDTSVEFVAFLVGEFVYFCTVFCGEGHALHTGTLIVNQIASP